MSKRIVAGLVLFLAVAGASVGLAYRHPGVMDAIGGRTVVTPSTQVVVEWVYLCGDRTTVSEGQAPEAMVGLDLVGLRQRFPQAEGWSLTADLPSKLRLTRHMREFCPDHAPLRHLGLYGDYIAVYEGPLGHNERVWRVSDTPVTMVPSTMQQQLKRAMAFDQQTDAVKDQLRGEFEFLNEQVAAAVLENLDELQD